jgi:hypothetical protein
MFEDNDLRYIFVLVLFIGTIIICFLTIWSKYRQGYTLLNNLINHFIYTSVLFGCLTVILMLSLPTTPVLKTFGYPNNVSEIKIEKDMLRLLQQYNKAIVRTTEVLYWFLFLFVWWFLANLINLVWRVKKSGGITFTNQKEL